VSSEALEPPFDREQILGRVKVVERGETTLYERALLAEVARLEQERDDLEGELAEFGESRPGRLARAEAALAVAREREQPLREAARALADAVTDFCMNDAPAEWDGGSLGYTVGGLASLADDARAALVDEPAAAALAEPGEKRGGRLSAEHPRPSKSGSASAAADEPRQKWLASLHEDAAADEPRLRCGKKDTP
jgi:hypothetical protein